MVINSKKYKPKYTHYLVNNAMGGQHGTATRDRRTSEL